ncbi:hypothetical protein [Flavobacterium aciduliphilum]|jgi:hypothetical protein|uniref:Uncharacterized protein n=1 Tax=Flavobacterium aciduliphilum TaxID=1101402 RepID=A0A328YVL3_9FLAO|nr:hypothetical protein [Flavobacterium aciduliphilum]RAR74116.1 hypothetical protein CLV55_10244 [Flavobacterium aciduliphilum]
MKKTDLFIGFFIGLFTTFLGVFIFLKCFTELKTFTDLQLVKSEGVLGKVITLGAILNIFVFFLLLKINKELMARGIVLATLLLAILTLFI